MEKNIPPVKPLEVLNQEVRHLSDSFSGLREDLKDLIDEFKTDNRTRHAEVNSEIRRVGDNVEKAVDRIHARIDGVDNDIKLVVAAQAATNSRMAVAESRIVLAYQLGSAIAGIVFTALFKTLWDYFHRG